MLVLLKYIHPKPAVNAQSVNYIARYCATELTVIHIDEVRWKSYMYQAVFFTAPWTAESLYAFKQYVTILYEGPSALNFK